MKFLIKIKRGEFMEIRKLIEEFDRVLDEDNVQKPFIKENLPQEALDAYKELGDNPIIINFNYYPKTSHTGAIKYVCVDSKEAFCEALKRKIAKALEFDDLKINSVEISTSYLSKNDVVGIEVFCNTDISIDTIIKIMTDAYGDMIITTDEYGDYKIENDTYEAYITYIFSNQDNDLGAALYDDYLQNCAHEAFEEVRYSKDAE